MPALRLSPLPAYLRELAARERDSVLLETARFDAENKRSLLFLSPAEALVVRSLDEIPAVFERIEEALAAGHYVAGYVGYECGAFFAARQRSAKERREESALPLAWFGVYEPPYVFDHEMGKFVGSVPPMCESAQVPMQAFRGDPLRLGIGEREYARAIERIQQYIAAGDTYQVNFTDAVTVAMEHNAAATFAALLEAQPVSYAALLNVEGRHVLSLSPELFFRVEEGRGARRIATRPMKGTMPRGLDREGDAAQAALLAADEKNRSEHVMIVDLLRNDLGRICEMGSVKVNDLFTVERYRTLLQMTSTVEGRLCEGVGWQQVFASLFPSGSITGAPKIRTMEIIAELEREPRGVYTGAIGYFSPSGEAVFNVAIRTLVVEGGVARIGVGGGIVADSNAEAEYRECELKASFLRAERPVFELIETMLGEEGTAPLLELHLERLAASAAYFAFSFDRAEAQAIIAARLAEIREGRWRLRLLLRRSGEMTLTHVPLETSAEVAVCVSAQRVDSRDVFLRHKTTRRALYEGELQSAREAGFDEAIFLNERGEVAEGAISTVFVRSGGRLLTPPLASGVLPGVLRRRLLDAGEAEERVLTLEDLRGAETVFVGNALRGLRRVGRLELEPLRVSSSPHTVSA